MELSRHEMIKSIAVSGTDLDRRPAVEALKALCVTNHTPLQPDGLAGQEQTARQPALSLWLVGLHIEALPGAAGSC